MPRLGMSTLISTIVVVVFAALAQQAGAMPSLRDRATKVNDGQGNLVIEPRALLGGSGVACGVFRARELRWSSWRRRQARAKGTVFVNSGVPDCAGGALVPHEARFRLYRARRGCRVYDVDKAKSVTVRRRVFTRVDISFDGGTWKTTPADTYC